MSGKLCILTSLSFCPEIEAAVAAEDWQDVMVARVPPRGTDAPSTWEALRPLLSKDCSGVLIIGQPGVQGAGTPPEDWPPVRLVPVDECCELAGGESLIAEAIARGAYLITPRWLEDWPARLRELGFKEGSGTAEFVRDFASELILLDTGLSPDAPARLIELGHATGLPAGRVAVGLDYIRLTLARLVGEWRLEQQQREAHEREQAHARELADHVSAMDFLGRITALKTEQEAIAVIREMFHMLFAPEELYYVRFENGAALWDEAGLPAALLAQARGLAGGWAWTGAGDGFMLRIAWSGEPLGLVVAERFAFPAFRERYLNLGLAIAVVCGLAIENARTFGRIKKTEDALRRSESSLKIAQAMAHLGHWEWDMSTERMRWSDETFRILGYEPKGLAPSRTAFFDAIHPDDRALVDEQLSHIRERGGCNFEYRALLPGGKLRVLHCVVEMVAIGASKGPTMIGTLMDITSRWQLEMLGVVQDITDRKELEEALAQQARTDALTGCANRRYFLELAEQQFAHAHRYGGDTSLLMLDLDHFKRVNDEYGHPVGDLVLQKLVRVCEEALREVDVVGRLGGEEFAVLLPETGKLRALEVAERLRGAVAAAEVPVEGKPAVRFTVSVGVATILPGETRDAALARADEALYQAKHGGRNRVVAV